MHLAVADVLDADRPALVEQNSVGECMGLYREILASHDRTQIGTRGARAPSLAIDSYLAAREALLELPVKVLSHLKSSRRGRSHQRIVQKAARVYRHDAQRAAASMIFIGPSPTRLRPFEVRKHVAIAPAFAAHLAPGVEVTRMSPHVEQAVDR